MPKKGYKKITSDLDFPHPHIGGIQRSSSDMVPDFGEQYPELNMKENDGDQPSFTMPPFANGPDVRKRK